MKYRVWWDNLKHPDLSPAHCNVEDVDNSEDAIEKAKRIIEYKSSVDGKVLVNFRAELITEDMEWQDKLENIKLKHILRKGGFKVVDL